MMNWKENAWVMEREKSDFERVQIITESVTFVLGWLQKKKKI